MARTRVIPDKRRKALIRDLRRAGETKIPAETRHAEHMERVHAVMRRSQYERVLAKIAFYEKCEREALPPLEDHERDSLRYLRELRDALRREMIEHGQIEPA